MVRAVQEGRWSAPARESPIYEAVFGDRASQPRFLPLERMRRNRRWIDQILQEYRPLYLGRPGLAVLPGDVDPDLSLLIGDLGPDMPFALDYRPGFDVPTVIYLGTGPGWVEIAPSVQVLIEALGL